MKHQKAAVRKRPVTRTVEPSTKKHICIACGHVAVPRRQTFHSGCSGEVCAKCGSEDIFAYETKSDIAEHKRACAEDQEAKEAAAKRRRRSEYW
jgi:predicted  nucleic acid-binding Zn-ribbon protein